MLKKIYTELQLIRKELQTIRSIVEPMQKSITRTKSVDKWFS